MVAIPGGTPVAGEDQPVRHVVPIAAAVHLDARNTHATFHAVAARLRDGIVELHQVE